ncbi:hypothetical protein DLB95_27710 [Salmonella enterica subsp. diarizonae]|uniref:Uncharacterized protein n=3 Tax=Salmonella enterica TaxID=28901 RepID=A0A403T6N5_SALER|nr:hypothetical protein [Salmonella enterica subsp. diarizonae]EAC0790366.1 hypothetical protein [Salmonella enterica subsp. enterica serovar Java]EAU6348437.1 hypothetical protein [Salmonella enterica]EBZ8403734.1 hypothetical protein [Salmonella enterica subsp. enterica serovar Muenchen]ECB3301934.1 hypothetical protein [Salmonella enterica subsp. enterica serovar Newport]EDW2061149.1 hypothetical protein [Salmonella enterica subsp. enterica serovar Oslo]HEB6459149.1 hypothetical protein [S
MQELLENDIDADVTDIRIDVEKKGAKCIRVSDICKDELSQRGRLYTLRYDLLVGILQQRSRRMSLMLVLIRREMEEMGR